ncbi:glycosyltransferase [Fontimonas sp. SYSU GA230001]|uniref:glycosyltransferase n=1 Tax=Fontimonas sp. SYSU GA230001 TaxID=3142450 RepID=UPI0032B4BB7E
MSGPWRLHPPLSIVVAFHNMRREAARTLFALTTAFQRNVHERDYEVIVIDSNSREALDARWVESLQRNFRYRYVESDVPTPNKAMNAGIRMARGRHVCCMIDGARIPSPGVVSGMIRASSALNPAYVMTLGMHLGPKSQDQSVSEGYDQTVEDRLLDTVDWKSDGYELFRIAAPAVSSRGGYFAPIAESNCFTAPRKVLLDIGGFDERFVEPGGGLVNLHIHNRLVTHPQLQPVMLLGEATFHQFHGGVATNTPAAQSPFARFCAEYERVVGRPFGKAWREPLYFGAMPLQARALLLPGD